MGVLRFADYRFFPLDDIRFLSPSVVADQAALYIQLIDGSVTSVKWLATLMRKILMTTFGSYGDLHPYIGMAKALIANGDQVTIATHADYQEHVERVGARFVLIRPGLEEAGPKEKWAPQVNHPVFGPRFIMQTFVMPYLEESYNTIKRAAAGHDLIISHVLCVATPLAADELRIPWVSTILQPATFFSAYDPPALGFMTILPKLKWIGPKWMRRVLNAMAKPTEAWMKPLARFRKKLGLPRSRKNVLIDSCSPYGTLALFAPAFAPPMPDWPINTQQIGFPLFDEESTDSLSPGLVDFLDEGPPPVVFTLGTAVVMMETPYYEIAYDVVKSLGLRAVFLVGKTPMRVPLAAENDPNIYISPYEPFSKLFPYASVNVHQCGIGTTAQALASGRPQVCVPFAHDQPDNARRVEEMGCGLCLYSWKLSVPRLRLALKTILESPRFEQRARSVAREINVEGFEQRLLESVSQLLEPSR